MLTRFIQFILRLLAGAALTTGVASVVVSQATEPIAVAQTAQKVATPPVQRFTVAPDVEVQPAHFDGFTAVQPPKPKPKPVKKATVSAPRKVAVTSSGSAQAYARGKVGGGQFGCLVNLWNRESGWNVFASNASSGAYGIPQALPGSKMASAGADWRTNAITQINWGLSYISSVYGTPCAAWAHSNAFGWY